MTPGGTQPSLDLLLSPRIRGTIETNYYSRVNASMTLEEVVADPSFLDDPISHLALYTDHGVIHMRDVAFRILDLIGTVAGVKIEQRSPYRLECMKSYGCLIAYVHDIGMSDQNPFGRLVHAQFGAHAAFGTVFDDVVEVLWTENVGNLAWRVLQLTSSGLFDGPPQTILRELVSLAYAHSKSAVPVTTLNDLAALRDVMVHTLSRPLEVLYLERKLKRSNADDERARLRAELARAGTEEALDAHRELLLARHYTDFDTQAFAWLQAGSPQAQEFVVDIIDTIRCLRCADALRQRGTDLRTSGSYQVLLDQKTANAVYALNDSRGRTYLLEGDNPINGGEANLAGAEVTPEGDLRIAFFHGRFGSNEAMRRAARNASVVVDDVQGDVMESFIGAVGAVDAERSRVLIEHTEDNPDFAPLVAELLIQRCPTLSGRVACVPAMLHAPESERRRFLGAGTVEWDHETRVTLLRNVATRGHKTDHIDPDLGFAETRLARLTRGEVLTEVGARAAFVYIPLAQGLRGNPSGGYASFQVQPWEPLGVTGVIRGDFRNATVLAENDTDVLVIPKDAYLAHWHRNYTPAEFTELMRANSHPTELAVHEVVQPVRGEP